MRHGRRGEERRSLHRNSAGGGKGIGHSRAIRKLWRWLTAYGNGWAEFRAKVPAFAVPSGLVAGLVAWWLLRRVVRLLMEVLVVRLPAHCRFALLALLERR